MGFRSQAARCAAFFCLALSVPVLAVTDYPTAEIPFARELSDLKSSVNFSVNDELEKITIPLKKLKLRIVNPKKDPTIEPVSLNVPKSDSGLNQLVDRIAAKGKHDELLELLQAYMKKSTTTTKDTARVEFKPEDISLLSLKGLSKELAKEHHLVSIANKELLGSDGNWSEFKNQLGFIFTKEHVAKLSRRVKNGADLTIDNDLLPAFSKRMAGKFIVYRGPNCFHASLSFYDQQLPKSPEINIKEEEGYHHAMINYDELWRVIANQFYEVDTRHNPLKYGDLIVYMQVPEGAPKSINFKWIRHTSVYLFGPYAYSKGSKSPNSPYSVKTLAEEWATWKGMVPNLGVKIYRRDPNAEARQVPLTRDDWIY